MKDRKQVNPALITALMALPLILGISSFIPFRLFVYYYIADHVPYTTDIILIGPILSFIGVIISIITKRSREQHPNLWISGLIVCLFGLIVCVLMIVLVVAVMVAAFGGARL